MHNPLYVIAIGGLLNVAYGIRLIYTANAIGEADPKSTKTTTQRQRYVINSLGLALSLTVGLAPVALCGWGSTVEMISRLWAQGITSRAIDGCYFTSALLLVYGLWTIVWIYRHPVKVAYIKKDVYSYTTSAVREARRCR